MRAGWLAVWVVLVAAGCQAIPTAADFDFADADGVVGTDAADVADVADVLDVDDTADAPDVPDVPDVEVVVDVPDVADTPDVPDVPDVLDVVDALDVDDVPDVIDVVDVVETPDVPPVEDVIDVADTVDAATDAIADVLPDEVDAQPDAVPDVPVDPCAGKNCDDGNACTNDSCVGLACQHVNNTAVCSDGNTCTTGDICSAGVCEGTAPVCGNGTCDCGESNTSCAADCTSAPPAGMVLIPAGTFWMGCNATKDTGCSANEKPQHQVTLSAYYMDVTETTVAQYKACVDAGVCTVPSAVQPAQYATYPGLTTNPVNFVSWTQAQAYCKWRGAAFDLPTEAQWEMSARGSCEKNGSTADDAGCAAAMRTYPWGETAPSASYAVFATTSSTAAVGSLPAGDSPYGLHDISGNVWEWNRDGYGSYGTGAVTDPVGPGSASDRVYRGGGFIADALYLRAGTRNFITPSFASYDIGLRCMRSYDGPADPCASMTCPNLPCATNTCDPGTGKCGATLVADTTPCDDGNACTTGDVCTSGTCAGTTNCDDGNACTDDSCGATGCQHVNNTGACDDGDGCTTGDACASGACSPGTNAPEWSPCGEGLVCDDKGVCADVKSAKGMAYVPAGTFWMGCNPTKDVECGLHLNESPQHKVSLSGYYIDLTETTVADYKACVTAGSCTPPSAVQPEVYANFPDKLNYPVNFVSWNQARAFCMSRGPGFDLPTEAQWEMAARGSCEVNGSTANAADCPQAMRTYPWGEAPASCSYAVMTQGCSTGVTWPVGFKPAGDSPYGAHDMAGNVWEWTRDVFSETYYQTSPQTNPLNDTSGTYHVFRGEGFQSNDVRASDRNWDAPSSSQVWGIGFRCVRYLDPCETVTCPNNPCATNTCDATTGKCVATPVTDGTACNDGNACYSGDVCTGGTCLGKWSCDDGKPCTVDFCASAAIGCYYQQIEGEPCDDGNACTQSDKCKGGVCAGQLACDDGNACTNDSCGATGCQHVNNASTCDDGNACTTGDVCASGACAPGTNAPDWSTCGEGLVCDGKGTCADVKTAKGMAYIPAGTFWMGCNATKDTGCGTDEEPQHEVTLSAYYMDVTETTVAQYKACVDAGVCSVPSTAPQATYPSLPNNPVNYVTWMQSQAYCKWRGAAFDLPTEAQWEMAARGSCEKNGSTADDPTCAAAMRTYPWGETVPTASYAVFSVSVTAAVGSKTAGDSPYGLHDMAGNVFEWTRDWYSSTYYGSSPGTDPYDSASASYRVFRGGAFNNPDFGLRTGRRIYDAPNVIVTYDNLGLRCVRSYTAPADLCASVTCPNIPCATNTCDATTGKCVATAVPDGSACDDLDDCTQQDACEFGVCAGATAADGNEVAPGTAIANKSDCDTTSKMQSILAPGSDVDWYTFKASDDQFCSIYPSARVDQMAGDYDLCVYWVCKDGTSDSGSVVCDTGTKVSGGPNGMWGCCSANAGVATEKVAIKPICSQLGLGNDGGTAIIQVKAHSPKTANICGGYTLTWSAASF